MEILETVEIYQDDSIDGVVKNKYHIVAYSCEDYFKADKRMLTLEEAVKNLIPTVMILLETRYSIHLISIEVVKFETLKKRSQNYILTEDRTVLR